MMIDPKSFDVFVEPQKSLALAVYNKFAAIGPDLTQRMRWGMPGFTGIKDIATVYHAGKGANAHINLQLFMGAHLDNSTGLIEGTGKNMRNIKFFTLDDVDRPGVEEVIRAAIAYDLETNG